MGSEKKPEKKQPKAVTPPQLKELVVAPVLLALTLAISWLLLRMP